MPKGVEQYGATMNVSGVWDVQIPLMPKGVEQKLNWAYLGAYPNARPPLMPKGVEQREGNRIEYVETTCRCL